MTAEPFLLQELRRGVPHSARLLVAVSGGKDSAVLLHGVVALARELSLTLGVAHIDHGLRPESSRDAAFVESLASTYSLPFYSCRLTPVQDTRGTEAWAREHRYRFLNETLEKHGYQFILTAHHADDRAETVLMRFLANREPTSIHEVDHRRKLLRPLLSVSRRQLEEYCGQNQLEYCEDATNLDLSYLRNRYRHKILPFLEQELGSRLGGILADRAEALEDDAQALEGVARSLYLKLESDPLGSKGWLRRLREVLAESPRALQWRLVERVLAAAYQQFFGRRVSLLVLDFILKGDLAIEIPGARKIIRRDGGLSFNDVK